MVRLESEAESPGHKKLASFPNYYYEALFYIWSVSILPSQEIFFHSHTIFIKLGCPSQILLLKGLYSTLKNIVIKLS